MLYNRVAWNVAVYCVVVRGVEWEWSGVEWNAYGIRPLSAITQSGCSACLNVLLLMLLMLLMLLVL